MNVRDQLLEAAIRVYAEAGYRGATTRRIAFEAGVNEITLFRHFGSKDALIREAIAGSRQTAEVLLPDPPINPVRELCDWARDHLGELRGRRALIRTCLAEFGEHPQIFSSEASPMAHSARALAGYLGRLAEAGIATARFDSNVAATMLMGVLFADAMGREILREMFPSQPEEALREYVRIFLRGLGVDPDRPEFA